MAVIKSTSQNQRVLNHLIDHGYITQVIASSYGVRRLASRIHDLTKAGVDINTETRFDDMGVRYARYWVSEFSCKVERDRRQMGYAYKNQTRLAA